MCKRKERTNLHIYVCVYAYMYQISKSLEFLNFSVSKQKNIYIKIPQNNNDSNNLLLTPDLISPLPKQSLLVHTYTREEL